MESVIADIEAETADLRDLLAGLPEIGIDRLAPADGVRTLDLARAVAAATGATCRVRERSDPPSAAVASWARRSSTRARWPDS